MKQDSKIHVAGHRGLVGSALMRQLLAKGYRNLVARTHAEPDLTERTAVRDFFAAERPEYVLLAAARDGDIHACNTSPAEFKRRFANQTDVRDLLPQDWEKL